MRSLNIWKNVSTAVLALCVMSVFGFGASQGDAKAIFQARYNLFTTAYLARDTKTLGTLLSPDFKTGSYTRPIDRKLMLETCAKDKSFLKTKSRQVLSAIINRNKASVLMRQITIGKVPDRKTNKDHVFQLELICADTWINNGGVWQLKHMKTVHAKATQDGKPYKGKIIT